MSRSVVLWIPCPPDNANSREHWAVANKRKKAFWRELDVRRAAGLIPKPPRTPIARAEALIEWHYRDGRWHLDDDNAIRRSKPLFDYLVANGYLAGDTAAQLRILPVVTIVGAKTPALSTVRLTLTPVDA